MDDIKRIHESLISGIRRFFADKPEKVVLGLSGGLDSALVLALTVEALGAAADIHCILMPSMYSSRHSVDDAVELADNLGVSYDIVNITPVFDSMVSAMSPLFGNAPEDVTEENLQARIRGMILMAYSNKKGHLMLNTSNKSELAVGYGTLYGDLCGAVCVLGDVYKTQAYELCRYINREKRIIPAKISTKTPSAELRPNQKDSDSLPEYDILDRVLKLIIDEKKSKEEILDAGTEPELLNRIYHLINKSAFKLLQIPPVIKISKNPLLPEFKQI